MTAALNIDLTDPAVRRALGVPHGPAKREVVQLAGDVPDPTGGAGRGMQSTVSLSGGKDEVVVIYRGLFMTVDVYAVPGEPVMIHLFCPRCHKLATVRGDQKAIEYDPTSGNPRRREILASGRPELVHLADRGRLSIAPFECAWEIGDERHAAGALHTGVSLCRLRIAIDDNLAKDA